MANLKSYKALAYINSLSPHGEPQEITVLDKPDPNVNAYIVEYRGIKCSAIFNPFTCCFYADDVYGVL